MAARHVTRCFVFDDDTVRFSETLVLNSDLSHLNVVHVVHRLIKKYFFFLYLYPIFSKILQIEFATQFYQLNLYGLLYLLHYLYPAHLILTDFHVLAHLGY